MINAEPGVYAGRTANGIAQGIVQRRALPAHFDTLPRKYQKYRYAPVTRQMTSPTSSATRSERSGPSVTPTGRP
jgi:hypothetical protein